MQYEETLVEVESGVATITLNAPHKLNALGKHNIEELADALTKADYDDDVRCVVVTGTGRGFCVGADLKETMALHYERSEDPGLGIDYFGSRNMAITPTGTWNRIGSIMRGFHKPLIASINGLAVGGGLLLACAADIRIAADTATFSALFAKRGLAFEAGTSYYLPRLVGLENAFRMIYTGDMYSAEEAARMGLVGEVVPAADLASHTAEFARRVAAMPTVQLALARMELLKGMSFDDPDVSMWMEMFAFFISEKTEDFREGHAAFFERRDPKFVGH